MSGRTMSRWRGGFTGASDGQDGQRIVVALPGGQAAEVLLQRAAELRHQRARAEVVYLHVLSTGGSLGAAHSDLVELRRQVEAVGGSLHVVLGDDVAEAVDRKSTRLNSSHANISYAVFCLKKK